MVDGTTRTAIIPIPTRKTISHPHTRNQVSGVCAFSFS